MLISNNIVAQAKASGYDTNLSVLVGERQFISLIKADSFSWLSYLIIKN
jgi:hypothetical protein